MTWQVVGASVPGTKHVKMNLPCQDAFDYHILNDCVIVAVADGLGSAARSDRGAKIAVRSALEVMERGLLKDPPINPDEWQRIVFHSFKQARLSIEREAGSRDLPIQEFGTTLIVAAITPNVLSIGQIGDGVVVALLDGKSLTTISPPQKGEHINEVTPLTNPEALKTVQYWYKQVETHCVAIMTDGLQSLSINSMTSIPYSPFFSPFFEAIVKYLDTEKASRQLAEFLSSERICERTDDDKTLVIVGRVRESVF